MKYDKYEISFWVCSIITFLALINVIWVAFTGDFTNPATPIIRDSNSSLAELLISISVAIGGGCIAYLILKKVHKRN